jgi:spore coat polysaccharide biosynthesis protein SpsF
MGSSRLPGKPLIDLGGRTALDHLIGSLRQCRALDDLIVATSTLRQNDVLTDEAQRLGVPVFRGDEDDVAHRLWQAGKSRGATAIARLTADDALMDPRVVDFMVTTFDRAGVDCATSLTSRSFPNGFVLSVMSLTAIERLSASSLTRTEREHVIPGFLARPTEFTTLAVTAPPEWQGYDLGATLDTREDLQFVRDVVAHFGAPPPLEELLRLLSRDDGWARKAARSGRYWDQRDA